MRIHRQRLTAIALLTIALGAVQAFGAEAGVVNVNTAAADQLTLLPRVGPALAARIVEHREVNGPFGETEDLLLVRGIGEKTFALLAPYVTLEGETTLSEKVRATREEPSAEGSES